MKNENMSRQDNKSLERNQTNNYSQVENECPDHQHQRKNNQDVEYGMELEPSKAEVVNLNKNQKKVEPRNDWHKR